MLQINEQPVLSFLHDSHHSFQLSSSSSFGMMNINVESDTSHITLASQHEHRNQQQQQHEPLRQESSDPRLRDIDELLRQLGGPALNLNHDLNEASKHQQVLRSHRLMPVLYEVLCEIKESAKTRGVQHHQADPNDSQPDAQLMRLDNMLIAEGIADPVNGTGAPAVSSLPPEGSSIEQQDYRNKLGTIRQWYRNELDKYQSNYNMVKESVVTVLKDQSAARPITGPEVERTIDRIQRKFTDIQIQLKQQTCEAVMNLRSRFMDARRKRRNFSKQASDILNAYFYSHLHNPYPSEEAKEELARQCDITVSQVSNWFGNKRIRYKKNAGKAQEESHYAAKKAAVASSVLPYDAGMSVHHRPGMFSAPPALPPPPPSMMGMMPTAPSVPHYAMHHHFGAQSYGMGYGMGMATDLQL